MPFAQTTFFGAWYFLIALSAAPSGAAHAQPPVSDGTRLYSACAVCHAPQGSGSVDGSIPNLAGQSKRYLSKQMALFRSGARVDPAMQLVATHPTINNQQRELAILVDYLSRMEWTQRPVTGSGTHLRVGQETYTHICAACHGADGRGEASNFAPRIAGQHYPYLRRQLDVAAALHRDLAPPEMTSALRGMESTQKDALADYISRLNDAEVLLDPNSYRDTVGPRRP